MYVGDPARSLFLWPGPALILDPLPPLSVDTSTASSSASASSPFPSPTTLHPAPPTPPKTPNPSSPPRPKSAASTRSARPALAPTAPTHTPSDDSLPPPVPPKTPRSARTRPPSRRTDPDRPTFAQFLAELDPSVRTCGPVFGTRIAAAGRRVGGSKGLVAVAGRRGSRRSLRRSEIILELEEGDESALKPEAEAEDVEGHYWSPTMQVIDWSGAEGAAKVASGPTGLGVQLVSLEAGAEEAAEFPILSAKGACAPRSREAVAKATRRGISIQGRSGGAKAGGARGAVAEGRERAERGWDYL